MSIKIGDKITCIDDTHQIHGTFLKKNKIYIVTAFTPDNTGIFIADTIYSHQARRFVKSYNNTQEQLLDEYNDQLLILQN